MPADSAENQTTPAAADGLRPGEAGFSLVEFLLASLVFLIISSAVFTMLAQVQRASSYQTEVQAVLDNTRMAMDQVAHLIRQAGNDPFNTGTPGLSITDATEVRVRSDLTGSAPGQPDKGDPDGDTNDAGEDVVIRYNSSARTIEMVPQGGSAQTLAGNISAFSMSYFDQGGGSTVIGSSVRRVTVSITGATTLADPQTGEVFSMQLGSEIQLVARQ